MDDLGGLPNAAMKLHHPIVLLAAPDHADDSFSTAGQAVAPSPPSSSGTPSYHSPLEAKGGDREKGGWPVAGGPWSKFVSGPALDPLPIPHEYHFRSYEYGDRGIGSAPIAMVSNGRSLTGRPRCR
jgi:hypothetical protein